MAMELDQPLDEDGGLKVECQPCGRLRARSGVCRSEDEPLKDPGDGAHDLVGGMNDSWSFAFMKRARFLVSCGLVIGTLATGCGAGQAAPDAGSPALPDGAVVDAAAPSPDATSTSDAADGSTLDAALPPDPATWAARDLIAARLSRFLWSQPTPDSAIAAAVETAASGDDVAAIAEGMLADPRARDGLGAFFTWWLRLPDLATQPKDDPDGVFTADVRAALQLEAPAFGTSVILDGDGRYATLMTAPYTFMNETIARHYGVTGVTGPGLRQVPFDVPDRIGLLGEASVLARFAGNTVVSWPARRFWLVKQTLLCAAGLDSAVPIDTTAFVIEASPRLREQLETITAPSMCQICHKFVNPLGYPFIRFDSLGLYRSDGFAGPYDDASGVEPVGAGFLTDDLSYTDQPDLMRQMSGRPEAMACFAWIALNFAVDRPKSAEVNTFSNALRPSLDGLAAAFEASGGDIQGVLVEIVRTPAFLQATSPID
jgi:hypothetical protein